MKHEEIAEICHEANRAYQLIQDNPSIPVSKPWIALDAHSQQSAINGVLSIIQGDVNSPEESHQNWANFKLNDGWKYGPVKDLEKKEHPLLVEFHELSEEDQIKDSLFFGIVNALEEFC